MEDLRGSYWYPATEDVFLSADGSRNFPMIGLQYDEHQWRAVAALIAVRGKCSLGRIWQPFFQGTPVCPLKMPHLAWHIFFASNVLCWAEVLVRACTIMIKRLRKPTEQRRWPFNAEACAVAHMLLASQSSVRKTYMQSTGGGVAVAASVQLDIGGFVLCSSPNLESPCCNYTWLDATRNYGYT